jgi:uncharacterized protein (TIGR02996 family)
MSLSSCPPELLDLLHAVSDRPGDEQARLILADWLDENGGPADVARAELIRLQCRLAALPPDDLACLELQRRQRDLIQAHAPAWLGPWRRCRWSLQRGSIVLHASAQQLRKAESTPVLFAWLDRWHLPDGETVENVGNLITLPALAPVARIIVQAIRRGFAAQPGHTATANLNLILEHVERAAGSPPPRSHYDAPGPSAVRRLPEPHAEFIHELAFLPDGDTFVSASEDGTAGVWSLRRGRRLRTLDAHDGPVNTLAVTPDGKWLLTGSDDLTVRVWATRSWSVRRVLRGHTAYVRQVAAGPGDLAASAAQDCSVRLWDLGTGACVHTLTHPAGVYRVAIAPDGRTLATGTLDNVLTFWDLPACTERFRVADRQRQAVPLGGGLYRTIGASPAEGRGHTHIPNVMRFTGEAEMISAEDRILFWDAATAQVTRSLPGHGHEVEDFDLLPGRRLVTGAKNGIKVWDLDAGTAVAHPGLVREVRALAAPADGTAVVVGCLDGTLHVLSPEAVTLQCHTDSVERVALSADGRRGVTAGGDGSFYLWDLAGAGPGRPLDAPLRDGVPPFALSADGKRLVTAGERGEVRAWDAASGKPVGVLHPDDEEVWALALTADGKRAVVGRKGGPLLRWTLSAGSAEPFDGRTEWVDRVLLSDDGRFAVTRGLFKPEGAQEGAQDVYHFQGWDVKRGVLLWTRADPDNGGVLHALTPDNRLLAGRAEGGPLRLHDLEGTFLRAAPLDGPVLAVQPLPDGRLLLATSPERRGLELGWWNPRSGRRRPGTPTGLRQATAVSFTPDGRWAAVLDGGEVVLWDVRAGQARARFRADTPITAAAITPDGKAVVAGEWNGWVRVFRAPRGGRKTT